MAIKISGNIAIDNNRDFFGRHATFTGTVSAEHIISTDDMVVDDILTITGRNGESLVVNEGRMILGKHSNGAGAWYRRSTDNTSYWFVGLDGAGENPDYRWYTTYNNNGNVMTLDKWGNLDVDGDIVITGIGHFDGEILGNKLDFGPTYPCFSVILIPDWNPNNNNGMVADTYYTVRDNWSTADEGFDVNGDFNLSTGKFRAPTDGIYEFSYNLAPNLLDESSYYWASRALHKNSSGLYLSQRGHIMDTSKGLYVGSWSNSNNIQLDYPFSTSATFMIKMSDGDTIELQIKTSLDNDTGSIFLDSFAEGAYVNYFSGKLISKTTA